MAAIRYYCQLFYGYTRREKHKDLEEALKNLHQCAPDFAKDAYITRGPGVSPQLEQ